MYSLLLKISKCKCKKDEWKVQENLGIRKSDIYER